LLLTVWWLPARRGSSSRRGGPGRSEGARAPAAGGSPDATDAGRLHAAADVSAGQRGTGTEADQPRTARGTRPTVGQTQEVRVQPVATRHRQPVMLNHRHLIRPHTKIRI